MIRHKNNKSKIYIIEPFVTLSIVISPASTSFHWIPLSRRLMKRFFITLVKDKNQMLLRQYVHLIISCSYRAKIVCCKKIYWKAEMKNTAPAIF